MYPVQAISVDSYLSRLPEAEQVISERKVSNETLTSKKLNCAKQVRRYFKIAATTLSVVSVVLTITNLALLSFKAIKEITYSKALSKGISRVKDWYVYELTYDYNAIFAKAFPIVNTVSMFAVSLGFGIATLATYITILVLDKYIEKREASLEKQEAFYKDSHSLQEMDAKLRIDHLNAEDVVRFKLLPEGSSKREYALFLIAMKDYQNIANVNNKHNVAKVYSELKNQGAK